MKKYYSIRVIKAKNLEQAFEEIISENFCDDDELCDKILTKREAHEAFRKIDGWKKGEIGAFLTSGKTGDVMYTEKSDANITGLASTYAVKVKTERMYAIKKENGKEVENLVKITIL